MSCFANSKYCKALAPVFLFLLVAVSAAPAGVASQNDSAVYPGAVWARIDDPADAGRVIAARINDKGGVFVG